MQEDEWAKSFEESFSAYKEKRIVLYGLGLRTATIISKLKKFHIIGLMDKDVSNVGSYYYGIPVISSEEALQKADLIVINTSPSYWKIIYDRIKHLSIPIYYANGKQAFSYQNDISENWYTQVERLENGYFANKIEMKMIGLIKNKIFCNKMYDEEKEKICFSSLKDFGYCVWGAVIFTFLVWIYQKAKKNDVCKLWFLAREGWFLLEDYEYLFSLLDIDNYPSGIYLAASRRCVKMAAMSQSKKDFMEYCNDSYVGTFEEYMLERFGIKVTEKTKTINEKQVMDFEREDYVKEYSTEIRRITQRDKKNYEKYLKSKIQDSKKIAVIDMGYRGTIQDGLSRILKADKVHILGYYFFADLSTDNSLSHNEMYACFQKEEDRKAEESEMRRNVYMVESFLTAPHGMVLRIDDKEQMICAKTMKNQEHMRERNIINEGIKEFINDIAQYWKQETKMCSINSIFVDKLFGTWFDSGCIIGKELVNCFYIEDSYHTTKETQVLRRE